MENAKDVVAAVEAEVVKVADEVKTEVKTEVVDPVKAGILAQKQNFLTQLEAVKKDLATLQQNFEQKRLLGVKLEGALESIEMLLKSLASK